MPLLTASLHASEDKVRTLATKGLYTDRVFLRGLDKVTGRVFQIEAKIGEVIKFEKLRIIVHQCRKAPPEEPPESLAFMEIVEDQGNNRFAPIFGGWMFASTPAIYGLEHPVYDVWIHECTGFAQKDPPKTPVSVQSLGLTPHSSGAGDAKDVFGFKALDNEDTLDGQEEPNEADHGQGAGISLEQIPSKNWGTREKNNSDMRLPASREDEKTVDDNQMDAFYEALNRSPPMEPTQNDEKKPLTEGQRF